MIGSVMSNNMRELSLSEACQTPDLSPFCDFTREALKDIRRGEKILKIVLQHLDEDRRFWGEVEEGIKNIQPER